MKRMLYNAHAQDHSGDGWSLTVTFDRSAAFDACAAHYHHLTERERQRTDIFVEGYTVDVSDGDARGAEDLFNDLMDSDSIPDPVFFEQYMPDWTVEELHDIALSLLAADVKPADVSPDLLKSHQRADRHPFSDDDIEYIIDRLIYEGGI